jgi:ABC-2 type transport system ATP-binding protein
MGYWIPAGAMNAAININNLTKRFPRTSGYRDLLPFRHREWVEAVKNVSLDIKDGEFFGMLGPNGAGKTTLIKMLCCLVLPNSGTARVFGNDIVKDTQSVKETVGLISAEERSFYWRLTGRENLHFYASLYHLPKKRANVRIKELLELVGLADDGDTRFQNYSTGMRQKLAIARGLLSEPRLLFVDEPTRSLDPVSAQSVRIFLKDKIAAEGKTVVLATHNLNEAEQLCDRLAIMDHGHLKALGTVSELRTIFQTQEECVLQVGNYSEEILTQLRAIDGVIECDLTETHDNVVRLKMVISNRTAVLPHIMKVTVNSGAEIMDCQLDPLPLEEIFLHALHTDTVKENG